MRADMNISKAEQVLLKVCLGPLAILCRGQVTARFPPTTFCLVALTLLCFPPVLQVDDNNDGGFRFSDDDLDLFRSLATAMFTTGVSYLVATSCTAVYYGAAVAVSAPPMAHP